MTSAALNALIVGSVVIALLLSRRRDRFAPPPRRAWPPALAFAVVVGLIYVNQVLFTVYVRRVHGGSPAFIAWYLPDGWFALAHGGAIDLLARRFPWPGLLALSVLRVQAFLELPFVLLAYLLVCRWFSPFAYRRARRLAWPAAVTYTATFCLIEWSLHNPYTVDDILIRVVAAAVVPLWVSRLPADSPDFPHTLLGLLAFAVSTVAFGLLVLVVYDTALLYNLGHLGFALPSTALVVLVSARFAARFVRSGVVSAPGRGMSSIAQSFGWLLVLFFLPALPIRYGLGFGTAYTSALGALTLLVFAVVAGVREAFALVSGRPGVWAGQLAASAVVGVGGAVVALLLPGGHTETRLLWAAAGFFVCALVVCAAIDRLTRPSGGRCIPGRGIPKDVNRRRRAGGMRVFQPPLDGVGLEAVDEHYDGNDQPGEHEERHDRA